MERPALQVSFACVPGLEVVPLLPFTSPLQHAVNAPQHVDGAARLPLLLQQPWIQQEVQQALEATDVTKM